MDNKRGFSINSFLSVILGTLDNYHPKEVGIECNDIGYDIISWYVLPCVPNLGSIYNLGGQGKKVGSHCCSLYNLLKLPGLGSNSSCFTDRTALAISTDTDLSSSMSHPLYSQSWYIQSAG